jgi:hypothetical protein
MADAFYLSFAGDEGWLGACLVRGELGEPGQLTAENPVSVAHREGCNPGGEVMLIELPPERADQVPEEFWNVLLTQDDLRSLGEIVEPGNSGLVKGTPDELEDGTARDYGD